MSNNTADTTRPKDDITIRVLTIAINLFFIVYGIVNWIFRLAIIGLLIGALLALSGCTTTGSDYRSPRSTTTVNEALRDFSMHAEQQRPVCAWYPSTMSMRCE